MIIFADFGPIKKNRTPRFKPYENFLVKYLYKIGIDTRYNFFSQLSFTDIGWILYKFIPHNPKSITDRFALNNQAIYLKYIEAQ